MNDKQNVLSFSKKAKKKTEKNKYHNFGKRFVLGVRREKMASEYCFLFSVVFGYFLPFFTTKTIFVSITCTVNFYLSRSHLTSAVFY